jgi:uncharacterized protein (TIGR02145 family)
MIENIFGVTATTVYTKANIIGGTEKGSDISNYKTKQIGTQTWMAENLDYYVAGSKCYHNDPANCTKYGRLYDWETAKTVCPTGWHLPSYEEWDILVKYVDPNFNSDNDEGGNDNVAGTKLKAKNGWGTDDKSSDDYGFSALPASSCSDQSQFYTSNFGLW